MRCGHIFGYMPHSHHHITYRALSWIASVSPAVALQETVGIALTVNVLDTGFDLNATISVRIRNAVENDSNPKIMIYYRPDGGMADAQDLKSCDRFRSCGFDSHSGQSVKSMLSCIWCGFSYLSLLTSESYGVTVHGQIYGLWLPLRGYN